MLDKMKFSAFCLSVCLVCRFLTIAIMSEFLMMQSTLQKYSGQRQQVTKACIRRLSESVFQNLAFRFENLQYEKPNPVTQAFLPIDKMLKRMFLYFFIC
jgi:hypothetical protein